MPDAFDAYTRIEKDHGLGYVLTSESAAVGAALFDGTGLMAEPAAGRGQVSRFPLTEGEGVLRQYRRGGLVALLAEDRFLGNRMLREFRLVAMLHQRGFPVPEPLGVRWRRDGPFYRGAIATRGLRAITLLEFLNKPGDHTEVLRLCGARIKEMHDSSVWHADLQVKNIMTDGTQIWLLDFDNARMGKPLSNVARARNLLRLRRSLEKHGRSLDNFDSILAGYGKLGLPRWLSGLYRIRGMVSDTLRK